jgi:hypothetical protein
MAATPHARASFLDWFGRLLRPGLMVSWALAACARMVCAQAGSLAQAPPSLTDLRVRFDHDVTHRVAVPLDEQIAYMTQLDDELIAAGQGLSVHQFVILVDRSTKVQIVALLWGKISSWVWLGASRASTGMVGRFEHFETPLGVFEHSLANPDFRAEGTYNKWHIRGYGRQGMRVYDLGWVRTEKGWGHGGEGQMRLQMHATDPDWLEPLLGRAASKGCIRIAASLNDFIDRYGLLDEDYFLAEKRGQLLWVLRPDRQATLWPGRYVVVVDSMRQSRPDWLRLP